MKDIIELINQIKDIAGVEVISYILFGSNKVKNSGMKNGKTLVLNKMSHLVRRQSEFIVRSMICSLLVLYINYKYLDSFIIKYINIMQVTNYFYSIYGILLFLSVLVEHTIILAYNLETFKKHLIGCSVSKSKLACDIKYGKPIIICNFVYFILNYGIDFIRIWSMNGLVYAFVKLIGLLVILLILLIAWIRILSLSKSDIIKFDTISAYSDGNQENVDIEKDISITYSNSSSEVINLTEYDLQIAENDDILIVSRAGVKRLDKNNISKINIKRYVIEYNNYLNKWEQTR